MKKLHKIIAASLLASATTAGSGVVLAASPVTANVGVASNYVWRGVSQNGDEAAVSGGIDYEFKNGAYIGTWVSNLADGAYENDIYGGYGFAAGPVDLDVGYILYRYPLAAAPGGDFSELYVNASYEMFSAGLALTTDKDGNNPDSDTYIYVGAEFEIKKGLTLAVTYGDYDFDDNVNNTDYSHIQVSLSKDDFTFAIDDNDLASTPGNPDGEPRISVSWSKSFDL